MINLKKIIYLLISLFFIIHLNAKQEMNNDLVVEKLAQILIEEYDKYENYSFLEKLVLKIGRKTYVDNINIWQQNYKNIDKIKIELHPKLNQMANIVDKNLEKKVAEHFRNLLEELTLLGFKNLNIYYLSVKEYLDANNLIYKNIDAKLIDDSMCNLKYYNIKKELYAKEEIIKNEIQKIMKYDQVKYKLAFYSFAFNFLNKIRVKIIEKDMERMLSIINEKGKK